MANVALPTVPVPAPADDCSDEDPKQPPPVEFFVDVTGGRDEDFESWLYGGIDRDD